MDSGEMGLWFYLDYFQSPWRVRERVSGRTRSRRSVMMLPAGFSSLVASTELDPVPTLAGLRLLSGRGIMNASKHDICGCM